jgi:uncharacterized protein
MRALVTGASSGIGAAFAITLSERGYRVVLVGRDKARLDKVAAKLTGPSELLDVDLTSDEGLASVEAALEADPVELLVNNAASGTFGRFVDHDAEGLRETVALNSTAVVRLSRAALPSMLARRHGGVIVMSSLAGASPQPGMATYAATKAFLDSWASSVCEELRGTGVVLTCARPGWVRTDFHANSGQAVDEVADAEWLGPDDVAARVLDAHVRGRASVVILPEVSAVHGAMRSVRRGLGQVSWLREARRSSGRRVS